LRSNLARFFHLGESHIPRRTPGGVAGLGTLTKHCSLHTRFPLHDVMHVMGWESHQSPTGSLTPSGHSRARLYRRGALLSLRYDHARSMCNALAGNLSPSLIPCHTKPRWSCTRWLIGALLLHAFSPGVFILELIWRWSLGYWPLITIPGDLLPNSSAPDHVSPCEWSTWLSAADIIDYRWPTGSTLFFNIKMNIFMMVNGYKCCLCFPFFLPLYC